MALEMSKVTLRCEMQTRTNAYIRHSPTQRIRGPVPRAKYSAIIRILSTPKPEKAKEWRAKLTHKEDFEE